MENRKTYKFEVTGDELDEIIDALNIVASQNEDNSFQTLIKELEKIKKNG